MGKTRQDNDISRTQAIAKGSRKISGISVHIDVGRPELPCELSHIQKQTSPRHPLRLPYQHQRDREEFLRRQQEAQRQGRPWNLVAVREPEGIRNNKADPLGKHWRMGHGFWWWFGVLHLQSCLALWYVDKRKTSITVPAQASDVQRRLLCRAPRQHSSLSSAVAS